MKAPGLKKKTKKKHVLPWTNLQDEKSKVKVTVTSSFT